MSVSLSILASGSAGNCTVVRGGPRLVLIDCGIGPRTAATRMKSLCARVDEIGAICLTHLDRDHFNPGWVKTIVRYGIGVFCHEERVAELARLGASEEFAGLIRPFGAGQPFEVEGFGFSAISLRHDEWGSHGFLVRGFGASVGYATDLGRVSAGLVRHFCGVNVLAIESNYDRGMQINSARPWFLKQRIMGGVGHLSNEEALAAVRQILDESQSRGRALPKHIVLLHRSRECNCSRLLGELFGSDERIENRLVLAEQDQATGWLSAGEGPVVRQLELQWA